MWEKVGFLPWRTGLVVQFGNGSELIPKKGWINTAGNRRAAKEGYELREREREREEQGSVLGEMKEWLARWNRSSAPQQNREWGREFTWEEQRIQTLTTPTSEAEQLVQKDKPVNDAGLFLAHCLYLMIKHRYWCICMKQCEKREGARW